MPHKCDKTEITRLFSRFNDVISVYDEVRSVAVVATGRGDDVCCGLRPTVCVIRCTVHIGLEARAQAETFHSIQLDRKWVLARLHL